MQVKSLNLGFVQLSPGYGEKTPTASVAMLQHAERYGLAALPLIEVRPCPDRPGHFELVSGVRTWFCAGHLMQTLVVAVVLEIDDETARNKVEFDLIGTDETNPMEKAWFLEKYCRERNCTLDTAAYKLGWNNSTTRHIARLLNLIPSLQKAVAKGDLSFGKAKVIAGLSPTEQIAYEKKGTLQKHNVRQLEHLVPKLFRRNSADQRKVRDGRQKRTAQTSPAPSVPIETQAQIDSWRLPAERGLRLILGVVVKIVGTSQTGDIQCFYENDEIRDGVLERFGCTELDGFSASLGMPATIERQGKQTYLAIRYTNMEQLDSFFKKAGYEAG